MMTEVQPERLPFNTDRPIAEMSLVEVAEQLERVTGWIEAQRVKEREARALYETVARQIDANVRAIKDYAERLVEHQRRKMQSFDSMLGKPAEPPAPAAPRNRTPSNSARPAGMPGIKNLSDAILAIWTLDRYSEALTTEEILAALDDVGYRSDAAPTSLRSSINQALAKLCRVGRVVRFRADGSQISPKDNKSRARKYLSAIRLPEPV